MFSLFKQNKDEYVTGEIRATQDGIAVPLSDVPDPVISGGILGEGIAILPDNGKLVSPVDGVVTVVAKTGHAFCLQTTDGVEILVHIGVDSVKLGGQGLQMHVKEGQSVSIGTHICDVDLTVLAENNILPHTATLVVNHADVNNLTMTFGDVSAGKSAVMRYELM